MSETLLSLDEVFGDAPQQSAPSVVSLDDLFKTAAPPVIPLDELFAPSAPYAPPDLAATLQTARQNLARQDEQGRMNPPQPVPVRPGVFGSGMAPTVSPELQMQTAGAVVNRFGEGVRGIGGLTQEAAERMLPPVPVEREGGMAQPGGFGGGIFPVVGDSIGHAAAGTRAAAVQTARDLAEKATEFAPMQVALPVAGMLAEGSMLAMSVPQIARTGMHLLAAAGLTYPIARKAAKGVSEAVDIYKKEGPSANFYAALKEPGVDTGFVLLGMAGVFGGSKRLWHDWNFKTGKGFVETYAKQDPQAAMQAMREVATAGEWKGVPRAEARGQFVDAFERAKAERAAKIEEAPAQIPAREQTITVAAEEVPEIPKPAVQEAPVPPPVDVPAVSVPESPVAPEQQAPVVPVAPVVAQEVPRVQEGAEVAPEVAGAPVEAVPQQPAAEAARAGGEVARLALPAGETRTPIQYTYAPRTDAGTGLWYHGGKLPDIREASPDDHSATTGLYGPGLYLTDNPNIAVGYYDRGFTHPTARARSMEGRTVQSTPLNNPRLIPLEQPLEPAVLAVFQQQFPEVEFDPKKSGAANYRLIREYLAEDPTLPAYEGGEQLDYLSLRLKQAGYEGFLHEGGIQGGQKHNVAVIFNNYPYAHQGQQFASTGRPVAEILGASAGRDAPPARAGEASGEGAKAEPTFLPRAVDEAARLDPEQSGPLLQAFVRAHRAGFRGREAQNVASQFYYGTHDGPSPEGLSTLGKFKAATVQLEALLGEAVSRGEIPGKKSPAPSATLPSVTPKGPGGESTQPNVVPPEGAEDYAASDDRERSFGPQAKPTAGRSIILKGMLEDAEPHLKPYIEQSAQDLDPESYASDDLYEEAVLEDAEEEYRRTTGGKGERVADDISLMDWQTPQARYLAEGGDSATHRRAVTKALKLGYPVPKEVLADYPDLAKPTEPPAPEPPPAPAKKEPWQMTKREFLAVRKEQQDRHAKGMGKSLSKVAKWDRNPNVRLAAEKYHAADVRSALAAGLPVPPEVLADYPNLTAPAKPLTLQEKGKAAFEAKRKKVSEVAPTLPPSSQPGGSIYVQQTDTDANVVRFHGPYDTREQAEKVAARYNAIGHKGEVITYQNGQAPKAPTVTEAPPAKEAWEMTRAEFLARAKASLKPKEKVDERWVSDFQGNNGITHRNKVKAALAANKPVPASVLADYPDLSEKRPQVSDTPVQPSPVSTEREQAKPSGWLDSLAEPQREPVLAAMRKIRADADRFLEQHRKLTPTGGAIPVGGAHIDPMVKAYAREGLLGALAKGKTIEEAVAAGKERAKLTVEKWNASRKGEYQVQDWEGTEDAEMDRIGIQLREAAGELAPRPSLAEKGKQEFERKRAEKAAAGDAEWLDKTNKELAALRTQLENAGELPRPYVSPKPIPKDKPWLLTEADFAPEFIKHQAWKLTRKDYTEQDKMWSGWKSALEAKPNTRARMLAFKKAYERQGGQSIHGDIVEAAIKEGRRIPAEVLAEYEFYKGMAHERQELQATRQRHLNGKDIETVRKIVADNLKQDPQYYSNLEKGIKPPAPPVLDKPGEAAEMRDSGEPVFTRDAFRAMPKTKEAHRELVRAYTEAGLTGQAAFDRYLKDVLPSGVAPQLGLGDFLAAKPEATPVVERRSPLEPARRDIPEEEVPHLPATVKKDRYGRYSPGEDGLKSVDPAPGMIAWTQEPDTGLQPVRIIGKKGKFDQYDYWEWEWLDGPEKGTKKTAYGRSFWQPEEVADKPGEAKAETTSIASGLIATGEESVSELRAEVSGVKRGPFENEWPTIVFNFRGKEYKAPVPQEFERKGFILGTSEELDKRVAVRTILDKTAKEAGEAKPAPPAAEGESPDARIERLPAGEYAVKGRKIGTYRTEKLALEAADLPDAEAITLSQRQYANYPPGPAPSIIQYKSTNNLPLTAEERAYVVSDAANREAEAKRTGNAKAEEYWKRIREVVSPPPAPVEGKEAGKEPWEMMKAEWLATYPERTRADIAEDVQQKVSKLESEIARFQTELERDPQNPANGRIREAIADAERRIAEEKARLTAPIKSPEENWTPAQIQWHHVGYALKEGKPVPASVLAEYPELKPKGKPESLSARSRRQFEEKRKK